MLNRTEFKECLKAAKLGLTRKDINLIMSTVDMNRDGLISYEEFVPVCFQVRASAGGRRQFASCPQYVAAGSGPMQAGTTLQGRAPARWLSTCGVGVGLLPGAGLPGAGRPQGVAAGTGAAQADSQGKEVPAGNHFTGLSRQPDGAAVAASGARSARADIRRVRGRIFSEGWTSRGTVGLWPLPLLDTLLPRLPKAP